MTELQQAFPEVHSKLTRQADAEKLFESFMQIMKEEMDGKVILPLMTNDMMNKFREFEIKINELYEDGQKYGFK